ncbi:MAG TPA: hypothetical protein DCM07_25565, partial [Planctomycetaceae bacterium]|nr:hypothetical protein [Planctomycetaceae bacterium]
TPDQTPKVLELNALQTNSSLYVKLRIHNPASRTLTKMQMIIPSTLTFVTAFVVAIQIFS